MRYYKIIVYLLLGLWSFCGTKIDEDELKNEITDWWGIEEIREVIIDDVASEKNITKILARIVILEDTTERMVYKFEKFVKGWRITEGPVDLLTKTLFIEQIPQQKLNILKNNMHTLQLAIEDFSTMIHSASNDWIYPLNFTTKVKEIAKESQKIWNDSTVLNLLPSTMINPYFPDESPVIVALGAPSQWFLEYMGKVIYFPVKITVNYAQDYIIKGSTDMGFIELTLTSVK